MPPPSSSWGSQPSRTQRPALPHAAPALPPEAPARPLARSVLTNAAAAPQDAAPDSQALRERAESLQARFERTRLRQMPRTLSGGSRRCDAVIGRLCIWDDGDHAPPLPVEPENRSGADQLSRRPRFACRGIPGDHWLFGQRVRYLVEAGRHAEAAAAARRCGLPDRWRCDAFLGTRAIAGARRRRAERAFRRALAAMPSDVRAEWTDPSPVLGGHSKLGGGAAGFGGGGGAPLVPGRSALPGPGQRPLDRSSGAVGPPPAPRTPATRISCGGATT